MKTLFTFTLTLALALTALAGEVNLRWDPSPTPGITNYVLTISQGTNTARFNAGTNLSATLSSAAGIYSAAVRAQKDGIESEDSNRVTFEIPAAPVNLRTLAIEASVDLSGTNWQTISLLRLRLN